MANYAKYGMKTEQIGFGQDKDWQAEGLKSYGGIDRKPKGMECPRLWLHCVGDHGSELSRPLKIVVIGMVTGIFYFNYALVIVFLHKY